MPLKAPVSSVLTQDCDTYNAHSRNIATIIAASIGQGVMASFHEETASAAVEFYIQQTDANASYVDAAGTEENDG